MQDEWIAIEKELPPINKWVLGRGISHPEISILHEHCWISSYIGNGEWAVLMGGKVSIKEWQPLPVYSNQGTKKDFGDGFEECPICKNKTMRSRDKECLIANCPQKRKQGQASQ